MLKAESDEGLTSEEETRYHYLLIMLVRRFEGFYFQTSLGFVDPQMTIGYEKSMLSIIARNPDWWRRARNAFSVEFSGYVDQRLGIGVPEAIHPGFERMRQPTERRGELG